MQKCGHSLSLPIVGAYCHMMGSANSCQDQAPPPLSCEQGGPYLLVSGHPSIAVYVEQIHLCDNPYTVTQTTQILPILSSMLQPEIRCIDFIIFSHDKALFTKICSVSEPLGMTYPIDPNAAKRVESLHMTKQ
jgi:hypothetical protein